MATRKNTAPKPRKPRKTRKVQNTSKELKELKEPEVLKLPKESVASKRLKATKTPRAPEKPKIGKALENRKAQQFLSPARTRSRRANTALNCAQPLQIQSSPSVSPAPLALSASLVLSTTSIPHVSANYISLQKIISSLAIFTHAELGRVLKAIPASPLGLRRTRQLLIFVYNARIQFIQVYVLSKWARVCRQVSTAIDISSWLTSQQTIFQKLFSALTNISYQLSCATMRAPDFETATQVLTTGRPFQKYRGFSLLNGKKLSPQKTIETLNDLNILLSLRLTLAEKLPKIYSCYKISDGCVTFFVKSCYQVQLGIANDSVKARFFFVSFTFDFASPCASPSFRTLRKLEAESNRILATQNLVSLFDMLLKFALNCKLYMYHEQVNNLQRGIYSQTLVGKLDINKSLLAIHYWPQYKTGSSFKNTLLIGVSKYKKIDVAWIQDGKLVLDHGIEFGQINNSVQTLLRQITELHVNTLVDSVYFSLSKVFEIEPGLNYFTSNTSSSLPDNNFIPDALSSSSLNNSFLSDNSELKDILLPSINDQTVALLSPNKLKLKLCNNNSITDNESSRCVLFSIDQVTGKPILFYSSAGGGLVSSEEFAIRTEEMTRSGNCKSNKCPSTKCKIPTCFRRSRNCAHNTKHAQDQSSIYTHLLINLRLTAIRAFLCDVAKKSASLVEKPSIVVPEKTVTEWFGNEVWMVFGLVKEKDKEDTQYINPEHSDQNQNQQQKRQNKVAQQWPEGWVLMAALEKNGLARWYITKMKVLQGVWNICFAEEVFVPEMEQSKEMKDRSKKENRKENTTFDLFQKLDKNVTARICMDALKQELERCGVRYRLVFREFSFNNSTTSNFLTSNSVSGNSVFRACSTSSKKKDGLPILVFDINSMCNLKLSCLDSTVFLRFVVDGKRDDSNGDPQHDMVRVVIQGQSKDDSILENLNFKELNIELHSQKNIFYLSMSVESKMFLFTEQTNSELNNSNNQAEPNCVNNTCIFDFFTKVSEILEAIEQNIEYVNLLRSHSIKILSVSMYMISFEYGPCMGASITFANNRNWANPEIKREPSLSPTLATMTTNQHEPAITASPINNAQLKSNKATTFTLSEGSPHKMVESLLEDLLNSEGLHSVLLILLHFIQIYVALQELEMTEKPENVRIFVKKDEEFLIQVAKTQRVSVIINIHSLSDITIHFLKPSCAYYLNRFNSKTKRRPGGYSYYESGDRRDKVCIQLKVIPKHKWTSLYVFVYEHIPHLPFSDPSLNRPLPFREPLLQNPPATPPLVSEMFSLDPHLPSIKFYEPPQEYCIGRNSELYTPLVPFWISKIADVPSSIPLGQALCCSINEFQLLLRKMHMCVTQPISAWGRRGMVQVMDSEQMGRREVDLSSGFVSPPLYLSPLPLDLQELIEGIKLEF